MIQQILVPTDFSPHADQASALAIRIAKRSGAEICFLHVLSLPVDWKNLPKDIEESYPEIKARIGHTEDTLNQWINHAVEAGVKAHKSISYTESFSGIAGSVKDAERDLILIGSHGETGYQRFTLGSTAQRIIRNAKAPVLVVQGDTSQIEFNRVVYASGLEEDTLPAYARMIELANDLGIKHIHFLEVTTPYNFKSTKEITKRLEYFIDKHPFDGVSRHMINQQTIETGILEFAHDIHADLLAIATHGRSDLSSLFVESIPENLIKFAEFPMLSIRV